jgi:hypothetical protein
MPGRLWKTGRKNRGLRSAAGLHPLRPGLGAEMALSRDYLLTSSLRGLAPNLQGCKAEKRCPAPLENRHYGQACRRKGMTTQHHHYGWQRQP